MACYAENKRARFDYNIVDTVEAGVQLKGFEVKAVKASRANLAGSFVLIREGEVWLTNVDIPPYQPMNTPTGYNATRTRKLLLSKKEINHLGSKVKSENLTLVPLKMYNKRGLIKVEIGLARGKKKRDKREVIKKRETKREIERTLKK